MNLTALLDVAIGLGVVYLGASMFVTVIGEYISQALNLRGRALWDSLAKLIEDAGLREKLAKNVALQPFFSGERRKAPSYVDPVLMARALLGSGAGTRTGAAAALPSQLREVVGAIGDRTGDMVKALSHWIDSSLTLLGERYKRMVRWMTFAIGLFVAVSLNLDTVALTAHLYRDKQAREAAAGLASDIVQKTDKATFDRCMGAIREADVDAGCAAIRSALEAVRARNESLNKLPIGWGGLDPPVKKWELRDWAFGVAGWLLTALALSLGAPFWFDLLGKFVNIRGGIRRPQISPESIPESGAPAAREPPPPLEVVK